MLDKILKYKKEELDHLKRRVRPIDVRKMAEDQRPARNFLSALKVKGEQNHVGFTPRGFVPVGGPGEKSALAIPRIITEMKKASPSGGLICPKYDPAGIAEIYEENGAAALSVLTDEHFFQGRLSDLTMVKGRVKLPVLRKDFVFDEYQLYEARGAGADAVLLIVRILTGSQLKDYQVLAAEFGMASLVEVHDEKDLGRALEAKAALIGINNRDLDTLKTDLAVTRRLAPQAAGKALLVSESGIREKGDIEQLNKVGVRTFLIGESLLREKDPGEKLRELWS
ncbi:MAG: indole-3-glycerol phosphate synthase TrpC [Deltaproteobacteria bacterium]|nr:indole-3-glycerol phosphate synthase TrpC [Deltaproteobacteria bacterium]